MKRALRAAPLVLLVTLACQEKRTCTDSGVGALLIPDARVSGIAEIQREGECSVFAPTQDCESGGCEVAEDGSLQHVFLVHGREPGRCTATVTFSDDQGPLRQAYEFAGPADQCCNEVCVQGGGVVFAEDPEE